MDPTFIAIAFGCGLLVYLINLPPLIGFLAAGFVLNAMGYESNPTLDTLASLGVTLLLFSIGLKLDIKTLLRKEVWGTASGHIIFSTLLFTLVLLAIKSIGFSLALELEWRQAMLMGFALSFSSTVFAVKVLEERSDMNTFYGRIAIGVLVMQDLFAVAFLTVSSGKIPSPWALSLLILIPLLRPVCFKILERTGHGELQTLFAVFMALVVGVGGFELVGLKGDLGALIMGMILASHYSASALAKSFFNMKELFLVAFFLSIGLNGMPTAEALWIAGILLLVLPLKSLLYYLLYNRWPVAYPHLFARHFQSLQLFGIWSYCRRSGRETRLAEQQLGDRGFYCAGDLVCGVGAAEQPQRSPVSSSDDTFQAQRKHSITPQRQTHSAGQCQGVDYRYGSYWSGCLHGTGAALSGAITGYRQRQ